MKKLLFIIFFVLPYKQSLDFGECLKWILGVGRYASLCCVCEYVRECEMVDQMCFKRPNGISVNAKVSKEPFKQ